MPTNVQRNNDTSASLARKAGSSTIDAAITPTFTGPAPSPSPSAPPAIARLSRPATIIPAAPATAASSSAASRRSRARPRSWAAPEDDDEDDPAAVARPSSYLSASDARRATASRRTLASAHSSAARAGSSSSSGPATGGGLSLVDDALSRLLAPGPAGGKDEAPPSTRPRSIARRYCASVADGSSLSPS